MGVHAPQQCIANHEINSIPKSKELQADRFGTAKPISQETVIVMTGQRKRYSTQKKAELIRLTYLPGNTVSSVARTYGISPAVLFRWRSLDKKGGLVAVQTGQEAVPASKYEAAIEEIKRLQRLLGQATADNAVLKDAVEIMQSTKWIAR